MMNRASYILSLITVVLMLFSTAMAQPVELLTGLDTIIARAKLVYQVMPLHHALTYKNEKKRINVDSYQQMMTDSGIVIVRTKRSTIIDSVSHEGIGNVLFEDSDPLVLKWNELTKQKGLAGRLTRAGNKKGFRATPDECKRLLPKCQQAIDTNYFDDMAHMYTAFCYYGMLGVKCTRQQQDQALREAVTALVLNRNSHSFRSAVDFMCEASGRFYIDWGYEPACFVYRDTSGVIVEADSDWVPYALTRALWKYEPGYHGSLPSDSCLSLRIANDSAFILLDARAEMECLKYLASVYRAKHRKSLSLSEIINAIVAAYDAGSLTEFIIYEFWSPAYPKMPLYLPRERIEDIVDYVMQVHIREK
jgi:hypothetical protein